MVSSRLELPHARGVPQKLASTPAIPSASPPCSFFSLFTHILLRDERCFSFLWKLLAVLLSLWFPEEWLRGVSEQLFWGRPRLMAHKP